jgi:hypothetical protein
VPTFGLTAISVTSTAVASLGMPATPRAANGVTLALGLGAAPLSRVSSSSALPLIGTNVDAGGAANAAGACRAPTASRVTASRASRVNALSARRGIESVLPLRGRRLIR